MTIAFIQRHNDTFWTDPAILSQELIALAMRVMAVGEDRRDYMRLSERDYLSQLSHNATVYAASMVLDAAGAQESVSVEESGAVYNSWHGHVCRQDVDNMRRIVATQEAA